MKKCPYPGCNETYTDETMIYCLNHGMLLVSDSYNPSEPTVLIPYPRHRLIVPVILVAVILIGGFAGWKFFVRLPCSAKPKITRPAQGEVVGSSITVAVETPCSDGKPYIVVKHLGSNTLHVQNEPTPLSEHSWQGSAKIGDDDTNSGEQFAILVFITSEKLSVGSLERIPADAISSDSVIVTLKK